MKEYLIDGSCLKRGVNGELYIIKPIVAPFKTYKELLECEIPNMEFNRYFYRKKCYVVGKVLHETDKVEIIDYKSMFKDEMEKGEITQYIDNDKIITMLSYREKETNDQFIKRVYNEVCDSLKYFSDKHLNKRFHLEGMEDNEKEQFTSIILSNMAEVKRQLELLL